MITITKDKLYGYKNKTIKLEQLMAMGKDMEYLAFAHLIKEFVDQGVLSSVGSANNGRNPSLHIKYRIHKPECDYTQALEDIKLLHPSFNHSKYAKRPDQYLGYKREIDMLSKFLWEETDKLQSPMSVNERSFQIWGREKLIKDTSIIRSIFKYNGWDMSQLNFYETPEPFFEYIYSYEKQMNVLIIENKDTWYSLRKIMREDGINYLFRNYNILLYGEGKKIVGRNGRLKEYDDILTGSNNTYYYFGDLDFEGIEIYQSLVDNNQELDIKLCTELYTLMLRESTKYDLPKTKAGQKKTDISLFISNFGNRVKEQMVNILNQRMYIPQEIVNYTLLQDIMNKGKA